MPELVPLKGSGEYGKRDKTVPKVERRLAAILATDVVGYSRLMESDEEGTHTRLRAHRKDFIEPTITSYRGRIVKLTGDGALVEFPSVIDAVLCAADIQRGMAARNAELPENDRIVFRIGINLGDVIDDDNDIYGDGVNIAARLEAMAPAAGICLSGDTFHQVEGKVDLEFEDLGDTELKNIAKPVRVYRVRTEQEVEGTLADSKRAKPRYAKWMAPVVAGLILLIASGTAGWNYYIWPYLQERAFVEQTALPLPDKPSIAVLPFNNMSADPEQEYFSDGITEDLITDLSRISGLFVIARNSVFTYKDRVVRVEQVARELGVRYVLEGSVRRAGDQVRINVQLIDAATGFHLWADRFDRRLEDVFALQDEVTATIVSELEIKLTETERQNLAHRYTNSLAAYDLFLRGWEQYWQYSNESRLVARRLFERAITLDPRFARAYANLALTYLGQISGAGEVSRDQAYELAQKAITLDDSLPQVHWVLTDVQLFRRQFAEALASSEKTTELDPNFADAYAQRAWLLQYSGKPEEALELIQVAMRLNPHFPFAYLNVLGDTYFTLQRYPEAIDTFREALTRNPTSQRTRMFLAASYAQAGRIGDAQWEMDELLTLDPAFTQDSVHDAAPYKEAEPLERLLDGLRQAGLSE